MKRASCGLMYGSMNTLKTTELGRIAKWIYEKYGLISRLISADNEHDTLTRLIEAGIIEVFDVIALPNPFGVFNKLAMGYWPVPRIGLPMHPTPPAHAAKIGAYLIEGTTTIGELLHQNHINTGRKIGEDVVGRFEDVVETDIGVERIMFAKAAPSHYGHVQDYVTQSLIPNFSMIPFPNLKWVWWTGHEYAGEDEATSQMRLGPGVVGKAATMKVPRKVGNTFHMVTLENTQVDVKTHKSTRTVEHRAYFESHADTFMKQQLWPAGVKLDEDALPAWQAKFPNGYIPLPLGGKGIEQYLEFHDELAKQEKLILTPGSVSVAGDVSGEVHQGATSIPAPPPAAASQVKPPARPGFRPPMRSPVQPIRKATGVGVVGVGTGVIGQSTATGANLQATPPEKIEEALVKSIEQVTGQPLVLPDINAVSGSTEPDKEGA